MYHNQEGNTMATYKRNERTVDVYIGDDTWIVYPIAEWDEYKDQHDLTDEELIKILEREAR